MVLDNPCERDLQPQRGHARRLTTTALEDGSWALVKTAARGVTAQQEKSWQQMSLL